MSTSKYGTSNIDNLMYETSQVDLLIFSGQTIWSHVNPLWVDLTSYWRFDENSGTNAEDSKGSYDGTATEEGIMTGTTGINNSCANFIVENLKGIDTGDNLLTILGGQPTGWTLSFWAYYIPGLTDSGGLVSDYGSSNGMMFNQVSDTGLRLLFYSPVYGNLAYTLTDFFSTEGWYHIVYTLDGSAYATMYRNGDSIDDQQSNPLQAGNANFLIGRRTDVGDGYYYRGLIDEMALWTRALSTDDVSTLYNGGAGTFY